MALLVPDQGPPRTSAETSTTGERGHDSCVRCMREILHSFDASAQIGCFVLESCRLSSIASLEVRVIIWAPFERVGLIQAGTWI
jgi:hypothetical protein